MRKKTNVFVSMFLCFTLLFALSNCAEREPKKDGEEQKKKVNPPKQMISLKQAEKMYKNYTKRRVKLIRKYEDSILKSKHSKDTFNIARYVEYDLKVIKQYIEYVEQEAEDMGEEVSTLRIYFTNYPNKKRFSDGEEIKHPKQNSVVLAPTLKRDDRNFLYYRLSDEENKRIPMLLSDEFKFLDIKKGLGATTNGELQRNNASMFPSLKTHPRKRPTMFADSGFFFLNRGTGAPPPYN